MIQLTALSQLPCRATTDRKSIFVRLATSHLQDGFSLRLDKFSTLTAKSHSKVSLGLLLPQGLRWFDPDGHTFDFPTVVSLIVSARIGVASHAYVRTALGCGFFLKREPSKQPAELLCHVCEQMLAVSTV